MKEILRNGIKTYPLLWCIVIGVFTLFAAFSAGRATDLADMLSNAFSAVAGMVFTATLAFRGGIKSSTREES